MTLQEQVLKRIRTEKLHPTAKGYFRMRDYVLWVLLGVFVAALSLGFGMIIFLVNSTDQSVYSRLGLPISERLIYSIPVFWIIVTIGIAAIAYYNFRKTRHGYRVSTRQFAIAAAVIALAFGSLAYAFDLAKYVDKTATDNIPLYGAVEPLNTASWFDPEHGLLSGYVKIKDSNGSFTLRDENFDLWTVTGDNAVTVPQDFTFQSGDHIKIIGKKIGDLQFQAVEVRPFETPVANEHELATTTLSTGQ